jgi:hypothetical protein
MSAMTPQEIERANQLRSQGFSHAEIAALLGLSLDAAKRRVYAAKREYVMPGPPVFAAPSPPKNEAYKLGGDVKDREILKRDEEIRRQRQEIKTMHKAHSREDVMREYFNEVASKPIDPPRWPINPHKKGEGAPEVLMTSWADWHGGEIVNKQQVNGFNEFNLEILERRARTLVEQTIDIARHHHGAGGYPGCVVNIVGDMVSGAIHPELQKTDEFPPPECIWRVAEILIWALRTMADEFGYVMVPCICGNHGRTTLTKEFKNVRESSWDYLVYRMLEIEFKNDPRIQIVSPESNELRYRVYNITYFVCHGDMMGVKGGDGIIGAIGPIMRGDNKMRARQAAMQQPYDILIMGHYHQQLWLPKINVANSAKGYCEYGKNSMNSMPLPPTQPLWFNHVKRGVTSKWDVMLDEPRVADENAPWLTRFNEDGSIMENVLV